MDPTANLEEQLALANDLVNLQVSDEGLAALPEELAEVVDCASQLAERVIALNEWITKGGFLPRPWDMTVGMKLAEAQDKLRKIERVLGLPR